MRSLTFLGNYNNHKRQQDAKPKPLKKTLSRTVAVRGRAPGLECSEPKTPKSLGLISKGCRVIGGFGIHP